MNENRGPAAVALAQLLEGALALPAVENLELEGVVVGLLGERVEHALPVYGGGINRPAEVVNLSATLGERKRNWLSKQRMRRSRRSSSRREGKIIVDFWAEWCGPCHAVAPVLDRIADEHDDVKIVKVNVDQEQGLAQRYGVSSIPLMVLFENGEPQAQALGALPKGALEEAAAEEASARTASASRGHASSAQSPNSRSVSAVKAIPASGSTQRKPPPPPKWPKVAADVLGARPVPVLAVPELGPEAPVVRVEASDARARRRSARETAP